MKKIAFVLAIVLCLSLLALPSFAAERATLKDVSSVYADMTLEIEGTLYGTTMMTLKDIYSDDPEWGTYSETQEVYLVSVGSKMVSDDVVLCDIYSPKGVNDFTAGTEMAKRYPEEDREVDPDYGMYFGEKGPIEIKDEYIYVFQRPMLGGVIFVRGLADAAKAPKKVGTPLADQKVNFLHQDMKFQMYGVKNVLGNYTTYVSIRDFVIAMNKSGYFCDVGWTKEKGMYLELGTPYEPNGSEEKFPFEGEKGYTDIQDEISIFGEAYGSSYDGDKISPKGIRFTNDKGGGYTYYQLRDLCKCFPGYALEADWSKALGCIYVDFQVGGMGGY